MYKNSYNLMDLSGLYTTTYVLAVVVAIVLLVISIVIANAIKFEGGHNPTDPRRRKIWFWTLAFPGPIAFFLWNMFYVTQLVKNPVAVDKFMIQYSIATGVTLVVYVLFGIIISKIFPKGKVGTWFNSQKK